MSLTLKDLVESFSQHSTLNLIPELLNAVTAAHLDWLLAQPRYQDPRSLARHRARVYCQNGEDGIIAEILERIGGGRGRFIEIGAGDGTQNCTRFLLERGWSGLWIEGDPGNCAKIRTGYLREIDAGQLTLVQQTVTAENVQALIESAGYVGGVDVLSIDIDMNTSHIWKALRLSPAMVVIEYNPSIPACVSWEVPYDARATWHGDNRFGASLKRLEEIGAWLGYELVGCELSGINAFFVRGDLASEALFHAPFTAEHHYEPPRFSLSIPGGHRPADRPVSLEVAA